MWFVTNNNSGKFICTTFEAVRELIYEKTDLIWTVEFVPIGGKKVYNSSSVQLDTETGKVAEKSKFFPPPVPLGRSGDVE